MSRERFVELMSPALTRFGEDLKSVLRIVEDPEIDDESERMELLESMGLDRPGLDRMNAAAYDALGLMSFYTIGTDETRAWTIRKGSTAPTAGGKVHSDIERGFIRMLVVHSRTFYFLDGGRERSGRCWSGRCWFGRWFGRGDRLDDRPFELVGRQR